MENTSATDNIPEREIFYQRARTQNRIFDELIQFFASQAEAKSITKRDIARRLNRDPAQITRWLSSPSNLTLDTISDLLLALEAEVDVTVHRFDDRSVMNFVHPWMEEYWEAGNGTARLPKPNVASATSGHAILASAVGVYPRTSVTSSTTSANITGDIVMQLETAKP